LHNFASVVKQFFKNTVTYLLIWSFVFSGVHLHPEDWKALRYFTENAWEHLSSGDTIMEFLQKHYGDEETVKKHYQANHPGEKPFEKKQHKHDIHLTDVALLYFPSVLPPVTSHFTEQNFTYKRNYTSLCVRRCVKPPEAA